MSPLTFSVRGKKPVPWACNELEWRKAIAKCARAKYRETIRLSEDTHFAVEIVFYLNAVHIHGVDLDNLAKPVLDTLFRVRNPQVKDLSLTGALFNVDDECAYKLMLEKRLVSSDNDEGADVKISW